MVAANRVALFTLACMALIIQTQAMDPSFAETTDMTAGEPAPEAPALDVSGMSGMAPTPDASGIAPAPVPVPTPDASGTATPATSEIQPEQMKGDDVLELSEEKPDELLPSGNSGISSLADQARGVTDDLAKIIEQITQQHTQLQGQLGQLQSELDAFYQTSGAQRGKIGEILDETAQPLTTQPTMITPHTGMSGAPISPANSLGTTFGTTLPSL